MREIGFEDMLVSVMELIAWLSDQCLGDHCGIAIHSFVSCARVGGEGGEAKQGQRPEPVSAKLETTAELGFRAWRVRLKHRWFWPRSGRIAKTHFA